MKKYNVNKLSTVYQRGGVFYFSYYDDNNNRKQLSTGKKDYDAALNYAITYLEGPTKESFGDYAARFFNYDTCPHVRRRLREGKSMTRRYVNKSHSYLMQHILTDRICHIALLDIRRSDVLAFQERMLARNSKWVTNHIMEVLKVILGHAEYEQLIDLNPSTKVGRIAVESEEKIAYEKEQIETLYHIDNFPSYQTWAFTTFVACTGMRIGEADALQWNQIVDDMIVINRARKDWSTDEIGMPKWEKVRSILIPQMAQLILDHQDRKSEFVFHTNGVPHGYKWIRDTYRAAVENARLPMTSPHAMRHTLNTRLIVRADPVFVQLWMGWSPQAVAPVQLGYTHLNPKALSPVKRHIDSLFSRPYHGSRSKLSTSRRG